MLDDLKYIHNRDASDALGAAEQQYQQLNYEFEDIYQDQIDVDNIVFAAMGGSAIPALISQSWPGHTKPFEVVRGYDIPAYVGPRTYFIAASYSGDTEETLSALAQAEARGAAIAVITAGGRLAAIARDKNYPLALLPHVKQSRFTVLYGLKALLILLDQAGQLADSAVLNELEGATDFLQQAAQGWLPTVPTGRNHAKQIALDCIGKSVVLYSGPKLAPAAYAWKIGFNENAKHVAWQGQYPEFDHNEFTGWSEQPVDKPYAIVELRSGLEHPQVQKRFEVSNQLLSGRRPAPLTVQPDGETLLQQLLWSLALGNFVSLYTALANGLDPTPVDLVAKLKAKL